MTRKPGLALLSALMIAGIVCGAGTTNNAKSYDGSPPFGLGNLRPITPKPEGAGVGETTIYSPKNPYNIFINYELGMHCVGFDISYCCIIPPYNSVLLVRCLGPSSDRFQRQQAAREYKNHNGRGFSAISIRCGSAAGQ